MAPTSRQRHPSFFVLFLIIFPQGAFCKVSWLTLAAFLIPFPLAHATCKTFKNHCFYNEFTCFYISEKHDFWWVSWFLFDTCFGIALLWFVASNSATCWQPFNINFNIFRNCFFMFLGIVFSWISNQNGTHKSAAALFFFRYFLILFRRGCFVRFRVTFGSVLAPVLAPCWSFWVSFLINFELFYYENLHFRHPSLWSTCRTTAHTLVEIIPPLQGHSTRPTAMLPFRSRICQASAEQTQTPPSEENFLANPP